MALGKHRASVATTREATSDPDISTLGSTLKRGAMLSALALGLVQVVSFVQTLILARILDPEQIGLYAAGTVLMGFLLGFSEGGLRGALIQREGDVEDAADTVFWVTFVSGLGLALLSLATAPLVGMVFKSEVAGTIAAVSSGAVVLHALTNVPDGLMQRRFNFKRRLIVDPTRVLGYAVVTITLAVLGFGVWSMVIGNYVGIAIWLFLSWRYARWRPGVGKFSFTLWRQMAAYAAPLLVEGIVERVRTAAETALIGRRLDANTLGQYRYGMSLAQLPSMVIVQIGSYVLFPAFSRLQSDPPRFARAFERALQVTWVGAAPFAGLMIAVGEPAVVVLLGEKWREAGVALMVMSGYGVGIALQAVGSEVIKAVGASKMLNWTTATSLVLGIGTLIALLPLGLIGVGIAMSITEIAVGIVVLVLSRRVVKFSTGRLAWMLVPPAIAATVAMAALWWLDRNVFGADEHGVVLGILLLILETIIFAIIYLAVLTVIAPKLGRSMIGAVMNKLRRGGGDDEDDDEDGDEDDSAAVGAGPGPTGPDRELVGAAPSASEMTIQLPPMTASGMIGLARAVISEGLDDATVQMRLIQPMPTVRSRNRSDRKLPLAPLPQRTSADDGRHATDETIVMKAVTDDGLPPATDAPAGAEQTVTTKAAGSGGDDLFAAPDDSSRDATVTSDGRRWSGRLESLQPTTASGVAPGPNSGEPGPTTPEPPEARAAQSGPAQSGPAKAGPAKAGPAKAGPTTPEPAKPAAAKPGAGAAGPPADPEATRAQAPVAPEAGTDAEATTVTRSVTPSAGGTGTPARRPSPRPRPTPRDDAPQPPGDSSTTAKVPAANPGTGSPQATPAPSAAPDDPARTAPEPSRPAEPTRSGKTGGPAPSTPEQAPADRPGEAPKSGRVDEETRKLAARPPQAKAEPGPTPDAPTPTRPGSNGAPSRPGGPQAKATGPKPVQPKPVQPKPVQPKPVQPRPAQPKPGGPSTAPPRVGGRNGTQPKPGSPDGGSADNSGSNTPSPNGTPSRTGSPNGTPSRTGGPIATPHGTASPKGTPSGTGSPKGTPSGTGSASGTPSGTGSANGSPPSSGSPNGAPPRSSGPTGAPPRPAVRNGGQPGTSGGRPKDANGNGPAAGTPRDGEAPRDGGAPRGDKGPAPRRPSPRPRPRPTPSDDTNSSPG